MYVFGPNSCLHHALLASAEAMQAKNEIDDVNAILNIREIILLAPLACFNHSWIQHKSPNFGKIETFLLPHELDDPRNTKMD